MVDKTSKTLSPEELEKDKAKKDKAKKIKEGEYYQQPPSDSDDDICGPLNCDKEL